MKAATDWIRRHYSVDSNPGQGTSGLYYYYHTFGKAMTALGEEEFTDKDGKKHAWRQGPPSPRARLKRATLLREKWASSQCFQTSRRRLSTSVSRDAIGGKCADRQPGHEIGLATGS